MYSAIDNSNQPLTIIYDELHESGNSKTLRVVHFSYLIAS